MKMQHRFLAAAAAIVLSACGQSASPSIPASGAGAPSSGAGAQAPFRSLPAAPVEALIRADRGGVTVSHRLLSGLPPREASALRSALAAIPHDGGDQYLIAIPGIKGVSTLLGFEYWNEIGSFVVVGAAKNSTLTITRSPDPTTPPLLTDLFGGSTFTGNPPEGLKNNVTELAVVHLVEGLPKPYLTMIFGTPIATGFTSSFGGTVGETWIIQFQTLKFCVGTTCNTTDLRG